MDETKIHEMQSYQEGAVVIWHCPICGRSITFITDDDNRTHLLVLEEGNPVVTHRGGQLMTVGVVLVAEQEPSAFEQWVENESDFDAPLIEDSEV